MPQQAWSAKRERQYEHIKESEKKQGRSTKRAKEIAARTVNKERARKGEAKECSRSSTRDMSSGRRGGLRSGHAPAAGAHERAALQRGEADGNRRPLEDEQGSSFSAQSTAGSSRVVILARVTPETLDHVALWVAESDAIADFVTERVGMHIVDRTDTFTLVGSNARRGKLTLFAAEGPREPGASSTSRSGSRASRRRLAISATA